MKKKQYLWVKYDIRTLKKTILKNRNVGSQTNMFKMIVIFNKYF